MVMIMTNGKSTKQRQREGKEKTDTDLMRANMLSRNCWMWAVAGLRKISVPSSCVLSTKPPRSATCQSAQANHCLLFLSLDVVLTVKF